MLTIVLQVFLLLLPYVMAADPQVVGHAKE
ncbi:hypothetical protein BASA81_018547, partial [Batrachochytrium salamandrivorans]